MSSPQQRLQHVKSHLISTPSILTEHNVQQFASEGYFVLRNYFNTQQLQQLLTPIQQAYVNHEIEKSSPYDRPTATNTTTKDYAYPKPGNYPLGSRLLQKAPHFATLLATNPDIVAAVELLLGEESRLSQHQVYCRTPGAQGTGKSSATSLGAGTHYDYKPWRPVGSFIKRWLFVIVPLVDYTETSGPILVVPKSHRSAEILPSCNKGRTHPFRAPCVPPPAEISSHLVNPNLKAGDVLFMDGSTWHEAWPNKGVQDRIGVYLKYHGVSAPPAVGPIIHPRIGFQTSSLFTRHVLSYNNGGSSFSGIDLMQDGLPSPIQVFDRAVLILEDGNDNILMVEGGKGKGKGERLVLPCVQGLDLEMNQYSTRQRHGLQYLDAGNLIKPLATQVQLYIDGPRVAWMSWICDVPSLVNVGSLVRVYAHRLDRDVVARNSEFVSVKELKSKKQVLGGNDDVLGWVQAWQKSVDMQGRSVIRGFGYPHGQGNRSFQGTYNVAGGTGLGWKNQKETEPHVFDLPMFDEQQQVVHAPKVALALPLQKAK